MGKNTGTSVRRQINSSHNTCPAKTSGRKKQPAPCAKTKSSANLEEIVEIITSSGAIEDTRKAALHEIERALSVKSSENEYRKALESLTEYGGTIF